VSVSAAARAARSGLAVRPLARLGTGARHVAVFPVRRRLRVAALHDVLDLFLVDGLVLHECVGHLVELVEVRLEDVLGTVVVVVDHPAHFLVDRVARLIADLLVLRDRAAQEHFAVVFGIGERAEAVGETPLVTMLRAISVARSMSFDAPVVTYSGPKMIPPRHGRRTA